MKLLVLSDLHLEFSGLALEPDPGVDVVVLAGDIVCPGTKAVEWALQVPALRAAKAVILVPGNHEYYGAVMDDERQAMREAAHGTAVHLLDGDRVDIGGVRFLGCTLWTDFALRIADADGLRSDPARGMEAARQSMTDYRTIDVLGPHRRPLTPEDTLAVHQRQRAWLAQALAEPFDGPTVVVTHHAPHRRSLAPPFADDWVSTAFVSELPDSFFEVPALWIHGHTHASFDYRVGRCRVLCNPRGYQLLHMAVPENPAFDAARVVEPGSPC
ncbi:metallophosphoesterase [Piscinibacter sp.]|uniref:metallophosphoesterase n=1 Tax=Piscinibacter sp. TaxID=1903157 RepID=UPI002CEAA0AE|nr:metallophosphoesterase [Albitalea sp.]HUG26041.1 metallophosphoesterase [Albitalea sp.]